MLPNLDSAEASQNVLSVVASAADRNVWLQFEGAVHWGGSALPGSTRVVQMQRTDSKSGTLDGTLRALVHGGETPTGQLLVHVAASDAIDIGTFCFSRASPVSAYTINLFTAPRTSDGVSGPWTWQTNSSIKFTDNVKTSFDGLTFARSAYADKCVASSSSSVFIGAPPSAAGGGLATGKIDMAPAFPAASLDGYSSDGKYAYVARSSIVDGDSQLDAFSMSSGKYVGKLKLKAPLRVLDVLADPADDSKSPLVFVLVQQGLNGNVELRAYSRPKLKVVSTQPLTGTSFNANDAALHAVFYEDGGFFGDDKYVVIVSQPDKPTRSFFTKAFEMTL